MQLESLVERYKLPSGVWGRAPAEVEALKYDMVIFTRINVSNFCCKMLTQ